MEYTNLDEVLKMAEDEEIKEKEKNKNKKKKGKGKIVAAILAIVILLGTTAAGLIHHFGKKNKNDNSLKSKDHESTYSDTNINDLGAELEFEIDNDGKVVTGDIDPKKVVKDKQTGKSYVDKDAQEKSKEVGTIKIVTPEGEKTVNKNGNTEDGKYTVDSNGNVKDNTKTSYEVVDENGNLKDSGDKEIPTEFEKDDNLDKIIEKEDKGTYFYADCDYYNVNGEIVLHKGDVITENGYNNIQLALENGELFKTKPTVKEEKIESREDGVTNSDGTYSIFGLTFESKADYEQWVIQGYEGYGIDSKTGLMISDESKLEKSFQK